MMPCGIAMRASRTLPSSRPTCTPPAPQASASAMESLTMKGTEYSRHSVASLRACTRAAPGLACLALYCSSEAPPCRHASASRRRDSVSLRSGVMAYRPASRARSARIVRRLTRPEEAVGQELAHARTQRMRKRLPGVFLRVVYCVADVEAAREVRGKRGGERAAGAVIAAGQ